MRKFKGADSTTAPSGGKTEKLKIIAMCVALVLVIGAYVFNELGAEAKRAAEQTAGDLPAVGEATIEVPSPPPGLFEGVADGTEEQRVLIEHQELEVLLAFVRSLTPTHYETLEPAWLDGGEAAALEADPAAHRGDYYSVRGEVLDLRERVSPSGSKYWAALLRTADGLAVHARAPRLADGDVAAGRWARLDGLFFKRFADQGPSGEWIDGPLIVGSAFVRSYEDFGPVTEIERELLLGITDDALDAKGSFPDVVRWRVLAWLRDMPADAIDWEAATVLDGALMDRILADGDEYRGQPFILPVSRVQAQSRKAVGENPARLDTVYESWIGNQNWTSHSPTLFALSTARTEELAIGDKVEGRLVFLRNMAYDTVDEVRRKVPVFAAYELEAFEPRNDITLHVLGAAFIGFLVVLTIVIAVLWRREQARSKELQEKLVARRRARSGATAGLEA